ncbi:hypothetical protein [Actinomadura sp. 6N118]|uniref:hypothetical protein n=1 Tax=Actinomadura sp. 6N118 TaxID=3375151 RepID=UPI00379A965A
MAFSQALVEQVCPCAAKVAGRVYPVNHPGPGQPAAFSMDLVRQVADVLTAYDFPLIEDDSPDWYALVWCLWRYCYGHSPYGRHTQHPGNAGDDPASECGTGGQA